MPKHKNVKKKLVADGSEGDLPSNLKRGLQLSSERSLNPEKIDPDSIVEFLESYQDLVNPIHREPLKLISIKIPNALLNSFKIKAQHLGVPYQTQIKTLMANWLKDPV